MANVTIDKELLLQKLKEYLNVPELIEKIKACQGLHIFELPGALLEVIIMVIKTVEQIVSDITEAGSGTGQAKKDAVVDFLDDVIRVPFWLEPFDGKIIGLVVDTIVSVANRWLGHDWLKSDVVK